MIFNLSILQLLFLPSLLMIVSGLALYNFQIVFRFLTLNLKSYMTIPAVQMLRPYADKLRDALENVLGKASSFKFNVSHVLMMAVVIMLLAVFEAIQKNNQLQEQQLKLRQKAKRA
ncbi:unnamed protein product [Peronospora destructor]|uniref:Endoplasmic reticulum transmembrane protein n=1 Tax=Peronospora destructor TaxID=86335 RepID=A0AAV0TMR9_9STRA|nr:unnamed protein product [Peronospora destructor]